MNYVLEQVPPPRPDLPRPRFSLYLSSQLQYGVILVYHRQCAILLGESSSTGCWAQMLRSHVCDLVLVLFRGTSLHSGPTFETEDNPENWYGWLQQVGTAAHICLMLQTQNTCCGFSLFYRQTQVLSDALSLLEETDRASDPLFGEMAKDLAMPSPTSLIKVPNANICEWRQNWNHWNNKSCETVLCLFCVSDGRGLSGRSISGASWTNRLSCCCYN